MAGAGFEIQHFFDPTTSTLSYLLWDPSTKDAVVIDPVLDFDPASSQIEQTSLQVLCDEIKAKALTPRWVLETHAHADHFSGAHALKQIFPKARVAIGRRICEVQTLFKEVFELGPEFVPDGRQFDHLFNDGERVDLGALSFEVLSTPGHTPACCSYLFSKHLFCGDTLFSPDLGTGRCDFPGGSASALYRSVKTKIYSLPADANVHPGHDYPPEGRGVAWSSTVDDQKKQNTHIKASTTEAEYIAFRTSRDRTLSAPRLLYPSLFVNITNGQLPRSPSGRVFLKLPVFEPNLPLPHL